MTKRRSKVSIAKLSQVQIVRDDLVISRSYFGKAQSSLERNIPFELTYLEYKELFLATHCALTGEEFDGDRAKRTLERINPRLGYTKANTIAVCDYINFSKGKLDSYMKDDVLPNELKLKFLRQAVYQLQKQIAFDKAVAEGGYW